MPITRLLIANRGEIARRIMRSCRGMGIGTVAVYAEPDADAPFVREADVAVALGGNTSAETYLDVAKILQAAADTGADAVHPGYGFLAENPDFARAVADAGFAWIGPHPEAIASMGDKLAAKSIAVSAGVPTLPSAELPPGADASTLRDKARGIGYPLLVKAAGGGGGKGMRIVRTEGELAGAVEAARREATAAFANPTVFLERYLDGARHVEVQIFGDKRLNLVYLFERECSIQRRHQKIIEEAPSPVVDMTLRGRMGGAAVALGKAIGYDNAGTVEFLLDRDGNFYFLEANTRLQVEHPVTEAVTGIDLVREQILVAQGAPLSFRQGEASITGHAIEARLYAEDPASGFLPAIGRLVRFEPDPAIAARYDSGVESGSEVSVHFDPMLAKVIVHAPTRTEAAMRLALALERLRVHGVTTNRDFLVNVLRSEPFLAGDTTTDFIERFQPDPGGSIEPADALQAAIAAALHAAITTRQKSSFLPSIAPGWRNNLSQLERTEFEYNLGSQPVRISVGYAPRRDGSYIAAGESGEESVIRVRSAGPESIGIESNGIREQWSIVRDGMMTWAQSAVSGEVALREVPRFPEAETEQVHGGHNAPMPGKVIALYVQPGDVVAAGQLLLILEAMKMEHRIVAAGDGVVREVLAAEGAQVEAGQLLLVIEAEEEQA